MVNNKSIYVVIKTSKINIGKISSLLDGLEYIGFSRTIDENQGLIEIISPFYMHKELDNFLIDLHTWLKFKIIERKVQS